MTSPNWSQFASNGQPNAAPAPAAPPPWSQPGVPAAPPPWAQPAPQPAPAQFPAAAAPPAWSPQAAPVQAPTAQTAPVFGEGAFAGAKVGADRFPDPIPEHEYILEIGESWFNQGFKGQGFKVELTVRACSTPGGSPDGFQTGLYQSFTPGNQIQNGKCIGKMKALCMAALGFRTEPEFEKAVPNWPQLIHAMQDKTQQINAGFGPNPLKGRFVKGLVRTGAPKKDNPSERHVEWYFTPAQ